MIRSFFLFLAAWLLVAPAQADVSGLRFAGDDALTRVIIEVTGAEPHKEFLSIEPSGAYEIIINLPNADLLLPVTEGLAGGGVDSFAWTDGKLIMRLNAPMMIARVLDLPPAGRETNHRIVMDLSAVSETRFRQAAKADMKRLARFETAPGAAPRVLAVPTPISRPSARGSRKYVVVVDAGHGGKDPGASHNGAIERTIVLKSAITLRDILKKNPRYDVRLTRDTDVFIELEDRVKQAREWDADLFVSVHADAAANRSVEGATVYKLSPKGQKRSEKMSQQKQWEIPLETGASEEVTGILSDLVKRETKSNSGIFAELVLKELAKAGPTLRDTPSSKNLFVLLAPDVPAVLVEMGFLTNPKDARRLKSSKGRKKSMQAVARAIDAYFASQDLKYAEN